MIHMILSMSKAIHLMNRQDRQYRQGQRDVEKFGPYNRTGLEWSTHSSTIAELLGEVGLKIFRYV